MPKARIGDTIYWYADRLANPMAGIVTEVRPSAIACSVIHRDGQIFDTKDTCKHYDDKAAKEDDILDGGLWSHRDDPEAATE